MTLPGQPSPHNLAPRGNLPLLAGSSLSVVVRPTGGSADVANAQAAAREAMQSGVPLALAAGDWDFSAGELVADDGPGLYPGIPTRSGVEYKALDIIGEGKGITRIRVGPGRRGIFYANIDGRIGKHGSVRALTLIGTGINAGGVGIQMGGRSAVRSDLLENMLIEDVEMDNLTSGLILDDVTCCQLTRPRFGRLKYVYEHGYNVDDFRVDQALYGYNDGALNNVACTITAGSNTITLPPGVTPRLQVAYAVSTGTQKCFPRESYVGSIVGNQITIVDFDGAPRNALANGTSINFFVGRVACFGAGSAGTPGLLYPSIGSPFVSPYWSTLFPAQKGRIGATNHFYGGAAGSVERFLDIGGPSHAVIVCETYLERTCEGYEIGDPGATALSPGPIVIQNSYWGFKPVMAAPYINVVSAELTCNLIVRGNFSDSLADDAPWIEALGYGGNGGQITWEDNRLPGTRTGKFMTASDTFAAFPAVPPGGAMYLGSARKGDAIQPWTTGSWHYAGQDGFFRDLAEGAMTLNNPADRQFGPGLRGKEFTLYLVAGGANGVTLGDAFRAVNGTHLATIAAGTTGQRMILPFTYEPATGRFVAKAAPQWV